MYLVYYKNTRLYLKENEPYILHISKLNRAFVDNYRRRRVSRRSCEEC